MKRLVIFAATIAMVGCGSPTILRSVAPSPSAESAGCAVTKISDGDTFWCQVSGAPPVKVRMIGMDTPETHKPGTPVQCYGPESERYTRAQLTGQTVRLEGDKRDKDRYGRLLRYVWLGNPSDPADSLNADLVRQGFARADPVKPDVKYQVLFASLEAEARAQGIGRWSACPLP